MKALEILQEVLTGNYDLEWIGTFCWSNLEAANHFFGAGYLELKTDELKVDEELFYMYSVEEDGVFANREPDAIWHAKRGCRILLYKIDN